MRKFYVDTNIWIDYFQNRSDGLRPLGEFAFQFFKKCAEEMDLIIYSDLVENELRPEIKLTEFHEFLKEHKNIFRVCITQKDFSEAKKISAHMPQIPLNDIIHAILARNNLATMVTRDKHFAELTSLAESKAPEEISF